MMRDAYSTGWDIMGLVNNLPDGGDAASKSRENNRKVSLSALRSQFTSSGKTSTDQALLTSARYRQEESIRKDVLRERRIRQTALNERINALQNAMEKDLMVQHELTLDALEKELRQSMDEELVELENSVLAREELRMREELNLRLQREVSALEEKYEVEQRTKLEEYKQEIKQNIQDDLQKEHQSRLAIQKEKLELEYNQELQARIRALEEEIEAEMESRYNKLETQEIDRIEEHQKAKLAEREEQLRRGIRTRLEQQLRLRLKQREARLKAEYDRRSLRLEEDIAQQIQLELENKLRDESNDLEQRMREDVELAIARKRDELRVEIERQLESRHADRLNDRKARLREKYDLTFSKAVEDISKSLKIEIEGELERRMQTDYETYRTSRESEIQNRLARFRYEREAELRDKLSDSYTAKKQDWTERLELEFKSREAAARKAIMSEVDAQLRNERLTWEVDLDLLKDETAMELEMNMEERLRAFKARKEEEIAQQLERQLDKREEIMRNKALIDVRKRESQIRAEIEAQLGIKRAEIKDRLTNLSKKMDDFRELAEEKMRESITGQIEGEIERDEAELQAREAEYSELQSTDRRAEKRQKWLQSISGQGTGQGIVAQGDASALGASPGGLGASAGRAMRGILGSQGQTQAPSIGLSGMRAPTSRAGALGQSPPMGNLVRPVKAPIKQPVQTAQLPTPVASRVMQPVVSPIEAETELDQVPEAMDESKAVVEELTVEETIATETEVEVHEQEDLVSPEDEIGEEIVESIESEVDTLVEELTEEMTSEFIEEEVEQLVTLQPAKTLTPIGTPTERRTATMNIVSKKVLSPAENELSVLSPVKKMTPLKVPSKKLEPEE